MTDKIPPKKKKGSPVLMLVTLSGGALALLLCFGCSGVSIWYFAFRSPGGDGLGVPKLFGKTPDVSEDKYRHVFFHMTIDEVDKHFGGDGEKCNRAKALEFLKEHGVTVADLNKKPLIGETFIIYTKGKRHAIVGFIKSKKHGELSASKGFLDEGGAYQYATSGSGYNMDGTRDRIETIRKAFAEARYKKGAALKAELLGTWDRNGVRFTFKEGGALTQTIGAGLRVNQGTYKFLDDVHVEMKYAISSGANPAVETKTHRVLIDDDELILVERYATGEYSTLMQTYRRVKGS